MRGPKNGGNEINTIYLTSRNRKKLEVYKILEYIVLNIQLNGVALWYCINWQMI